ncbi:MAG: vWA domain-containing protein [Brevinema sp.]
MLFVNLSQFPLILFIFLIGLGAIIATIYRKKHLINLLFSSEQQNALRQKEIKSIRIIKIASVITALSMISLALLDPRGASLTSDVELNGSDIVFTFDLSRSMDVQDETPSRLELAKQLSEQLLDSLVGNRVGLVGFAADANRLLPLTTDLGAVSLFIKDLDSSMFSSQSTDLEKALSVSLKSFSEEALTHKSIILFTDGENLDGNIDRAIDLLKKQEINLFIVGMGTPEGGNIPVFDEKGQKRGCITEFGKKVVSKLDREFLEKIASQSKGNYFNADRAAIVQIIARINDLENNPFGANTQNFLEPKFRVFILIALFALLIFLFTPEQRRRQLMILIFLSLTGNTFALGAHHEAYSSYQKQDFSKALRFYQRSLIKNPKNEKAKFGEGTTLYKLERGERAVNTFTSLTNSKNKKIREKALFNTANAQIQAKKTDEALKIYKNIMNEYPLKSKIYKKALNNYLYLKAQQSQDQQDQENQDDQQDKQDKKEQQDQSENKDQQNQDQNQDSEESQDPNDEKSSEKDQQNSNQNQQNQKDQTPSQSISSDDIENLLGIAEEEERKSMKRENSRQKAGFFQKNKW